MNEWIRADRWRADELRAHGNVPIDTVAAFGLALLEELATRGMPHGALRPEVVSVRREGNALRVRIDSSPTDPAEETLLAMGSRSMAAHPGIHYRAPEQFTQGSFDARADCFAVGVMLYELAAGQLPFGQGSTAPFRVFLALKKGGFPSVQAQRSGVSVALAGAITRALALRVEERFDGIAAMATVLRPIVRPPHAAPTGVVASRGVPHFAPTGVVASRGEPTPAAAPPVTRPDLPRAEAAPLDPLRPIPTSAFPVATQAAIAAHRASEAKPREVPLPIRAIVEAVTQPVPPAPTPTPSQPVPRAEPPIRTAPPAAPVVQRPIVMVPSSTVAPPRAPIPNPPAIERPTVSATARAPQPNAPPPMLVGPIARPVPSPRVELRPEPTQVTPPPVMEPPRRPTTEQRVVEPPPAQLTVVAPPPPALVRATVPTAWPPPDTDLPAAPARMPTPSPRVTAPLREEPTATAPIGDPPEPPRDDTARRSAGEITPPGGSTPVKAAPFRRRDALILSSVLLMLGIGSGLLIKLPSRAATLAVAPECEPGPEKVCPPPEPVAMPDPTPVTCEQQTCAPPKPSPKLQGFYDGFYEGQRAYLRGDRRGAIEAFRRAEQHFPRNPRLLQWLGRCYEELKERDEARVYYERYLRRRPKADDADYFREKVDRLRGAPDGGSPAGGTAR